MFRKGNARWIQPILLSKHLLDCICPQEPGNVLRTGQRTTPFLSFSVQSVVMNI